MIQNFASPLLQQLAQRLQNLPISPILQPSAVLVAITDEENPKILYSLRSKGLNIHAGEVAFAGGKREMGDQDNQAIALRETFEETGILPNRVQVIGELPLHHAKSGMPVQPVVGIIPANLTLVPAEDEIARLFWGDLATLIHQPTVEYVVDYYGHQIKSPCFMVDNETVWGLTGRITASLLEIGFDRKIDWYFHIQPKP